MINIDKVYDLMANRGFQEPETGNLFFPAYIYTYPAAEEYELRKQVKLLIEKLRRPNHYLDCLVLNIYHELINYLKNAKFAGNSVFDLVIEKEKESHSEAASWVNDEMNAGFYDYLEDKVKEYFTEMQEKRVYLVIYGFGSAYPFIRASDFLKRTERLIKTFKMILFYPGEYEEANYSLFHLLHDDNMYRANYLNLQLGD